MHLPFLYHLVCVIKSNLKQSVMQLVVDPGFPRQGRQPQRRAPTYCLDKFFSENCMKIKEIGGEGVDPHTYIF